MLRLLPRRALSSATSQLLMRPESGPRADEAGAVGTPSNALLLSCVEVDDRGRLQHCRYLRPALCTMHALQARDLRQLDGTLRMQLPAILVRPGSLLVHLADDLRGIVTHNRVVLFNAADDFVGELRGKIQSVISVNASFGELPFEFVALECMLAKVSTSLQEEMETLTPFIEEQLALLERSVHWDKLKTLLTCKKRVNAVLSRCKAFRNCLHEVLESDVDMSNMYLSHQAMPHLPKRPVQAHDEVELLLESYLKTAEETLLRAHTLDENIRSTEEIVNIGLVSQRNELLLLELKLGIGTFATSMGGFGAAILGMNLANGMEHSPVAFLSVLSALLAASSLAFVGAWRRMLRLVHHRNQSQ